jgi:hypothetical protein
MSLPSLTMSNMSALKLIIEQRTNFNASGSFKYIKDNNPSMLHLDWEGAEEWDKIISEGLNADINLICRKAAASFLLNSEILLELVTYGRDNVIKNLTDDELQVFRNAQLLEKIPDQAIVDWWDDLKQRGRSLLNKKLHAQGRLAERWTIDFEELKTSNLGPQYKPVWMALEGDHFGYDILSFRSNFPSAPLAVLIEVKSFFNPEKPQFYITRNEWQKAVETENNYIFFIWCMADRKHKAYSHWDIEPHIPKNNGSGEWETALISLTDW